MYERTPLLQGHRGVDAHDARALDGQSYGVTSGVNAVATLDLRNTPIVWARTGGRGHVTVWAPPELLLRALVQCDEHD